MNENGEIKCALRMNEQDSLDTEKVLLLNGSTNCESLNFTPKMDLSYPKQ